MDTTRIIKLLIWDSSLKISHSTRNVEKLRPKDLVFAFEGCAGILRLGTEPFCLGYQKSKQEHILDIENSQQRFDFIQNKII